MNKPLLCTAVFLLMLVPLVMGMGALGESPANKIPVPEKKFSAIFIDQMDTVTECSEISIEGNIFIEGKRGEGIYTVPFEKIRSILFQLKGGELKGIVKLADGNEVDMLLSKERKAYGRTQYGTFQIKLTNLKKITFTPAARLHKK